MRTLVIHPGALGDVLQAVPALRALGRAGSVTLAGQPRLAALLHGFGLLETAVSFDGLGLQALFTREPPPTSLLQRLTGFDRVVSWFGARDDVYRTQLRGIAPDVIVAPPVPESSRPV